MLLTSIRCQNSEYFIAQSVWNHSLIHFNTFIDAPYFFVWLYYYFYCFCCFEYSFVIKIWMNFYTTLTFTHLNLRHVQWKSVADKTEGSYKNLLNNIK